MTPTLLGVPYDLSSSFLRGAAEAPAKIREALSSSASNSWSELGVEIRAHLGDGGDVSFPDDADPRRAIEEAVINLLEADATPIVLGGDHSITYPVVRGLWRELEPFDLLHIDAHPDLYDEFEGDRYSHACPMARILEQGLVGRLVQIGIRTANAHQRQQAERFGVEMIEMKDWARGRRPGFERPVYLSIDLDGLDPAFAPGVSHPEPGGLSTREVLELIHILPVPLIGADVVELNPTRDVNGLTALVAAKLVKELVGVMVWKENAPPPDSRR